MLIHSTIQTTDREDAIAGGERASFVVRASAYSSHFVKENLMPKKR
ncbi:MAG: hypothetical protein RLP02_34755 [Coleofasciculus sp. C2-GNP5-27]